MSAIKNEEMTIGVLLLSSSTGWDYFDQQSKPSGSRMDIAWRAVAPIRQDPALEGALETVRNAVIEIMRANFQADIYHPPEDCMKVTAQKLIDGSAS